MTAILLGGAIGSSFYRAWVATLLWRWFVVPLGAPSLGLFHAMGLLMIAGFLLWKPADSERVEGQDAALQDLGRSLTLTTVALGFGALVSLGVPA